jgi:carbonic anhydrase
MKDKQTAWMPMCDWCGDGQHEPQVSRRNFLKTSVFAALAASSRDVAGAADRPAPDALPPPNAITPGDALKRLMDGTARYAANSIDERDFSAVRAARVPAQYPIAAILSCADARVAPELAFDQQPGNLFVARVAGNIVNPDLLASIEYDV